MFPYLAIPYQYVTNTYISHAILPLRFAARAMTVVAHDCHPVARLSSSLILLDVALGRPGLLLPSDLHSSAVSSALSVLSHYMSNPVPSSTSDLITCSVHSCSLLDLLVRDGLGPPILYQYKSTSVLSRMPFSY